MTEYPRLVLPLKWIGRSWEWAEEVIRERRFYAPRACFGAENNVPCQAHARMAECAFTLWTGQDPEILRWKDKGPDDGYDVVWHDMRWDVKATVMHGQYLIWPLSKNDIFINKQFDAFVLVKHEVPVFEIRGWVSKWVFFHEKLIAGEGHVLPGVGTWHRHQDRCWKMPNMPLNMRTAA